jgi:acetyltransferase
MPAIRPYPAELEKRVRIGKQSFVFRAIRPEDEPLMEKLFRSFSEETVRLRFFHPIKEMTHEMLTRYCFNDYDREMAIVVEKPGKGRKLLGVGRFMKDVGNESAEFAVVVTDAFQRKGLGRELLEYVVEIAGARGIKRLWALVSCENQAMVELAKSRGFEARFDAEERAYRLEKKIN